MEFIILIFINIIMGTVFYLILRLRLEKHASDYREKRLKREIDEIISEFNETAERNITILENRIEHFKKLLEKSKAIDGIDLKVDDSNFNEDSKTFVKTKAELKNTSVSAKRTKQSTNKNISDRQDTAEKDSEFVKHEMLNDNEKNEKQISKYYSQIKLSLNKVYKSLKGEKLNKFDIYSKDGKSIESGDDTKLLNEIPKGSLLNTTKLIDEKDTETDGVLYSSDPELKDNASSGILDSKLEEMFKSTEDKYLLISKLFNEGYPPELICKCSGIPIGEIKLVLDLNSRM